MSDFHRPALPGKKVFEALAHDTDPAEVAAAGHRIAHLLVRGPIDREDRDLVDRVLHLSDAEGLGVIAELWSHAAPDTLSGALWRLYLLREWVHRQPRRAAAEFTAGRSFAPVHEVLAGVVEPPGADEVVALVDTVVRGIVVTDLDVVLDRAAAFAHIVGVGRGQLEEGDAHSAARLLDMAQHLRRAAALERTGALH